MRLHKFFIEEKIGERSSITVTDSDLINQWRHVLRLNTGSSVILLDNSGFEYVAQFLNLTYLKAEFVITEKKVSQFAPKKKVILLPSLIKTDKLEWVFEKGTEIGVSVFSPILSRYSVAKKFNISRANKIIKESSEQSGRGILPLVNETISFEDAVSSISFPAIAFDPSGAKFQASDFSSDEPISVLVGPEGGWSNEELILLQSKKIPIYSLGSQILRAETASIAVATLLLI